MFSKIKSLLRNPTILKSILLKKITLFLKIFKKRKVINHKKFLEKNKYIFNEFEDVLFVFQFFNKKEYCKKILQPFIQNKIKNIIAFADGCIDNTAIELHSILPGENHYVMQCNDVHEIKNYRMSLDIADNLGCKYVLLLQDDDIFQNSLFNWLDNSINLMKEYNASILSGCGGLNIYKNFEYKNTDKTISNAFFKYDVDENNNEYFQLGNIYKFLDTKIKSSNDASSFGFAAAVWRAPQLINVQIAKELSFFPKSLEPVQYDDYYNCFKSWMNNYSVLLAPFSEMECSVGIRGMELYNNLVVNKRPESFYKNWNYIIQHFGNDMNSGKIQDAVDFKNKTSKLK